MPDEPMPDEPMPDEPMPDEPMPDEPLTNEPLPLSQHDTGLVSGQEAKEEDTLVRSPRDPITGAVQPQGDPMDRARREAGEAAMGRDIEV